MKTWVALNHGAGMNAPTHICGATIDSATGVAIQLDGIIERIGSVKAHSKGLSRYD